MIKNDLTTFTSVSKTFKLDYCSSNLNKSTDISTNSDNGRKDTISISSFNPSTSSYRENRILELKEMIKSGEYKIDNRRTSSAIIEELQLLK